MLHCNEIIDNTYQIVSEIGSGGMGVVYLAYHLRLQKYVVMKKIKINSSDINLLRNEVDILKSLHHMYLPQVYDFITFEGDIYTIIDYIHGYDLEYYISNGYTFDEKLIIKWLKQLCEVLVYIHSQTPPVIHTDIKPANIIVNENWDICLIDFGISLSSDSKIKGFSKDFSSPEQYSNVVNLMYGRYENLLSIDARTDIYSLGATFYYLMTGVKPDITKPSVPKLSEYNIKYSEALTGIIDKAMNREPNNRFLSSEKMYAALINIKKRDKRYKKYVFVQLVSSLLAGVLILSGVLTIFFGNAQAGQNEYKAMYDSFVEDYNKGDYKETVNQGNLLLNNSKYEAYYSDATRAHILKAMADSCFESQDFANAVQYYGYAIKYAAASDNPVNYYRSYAVSLVYMQNYDYANQVVAEAQAKYPDSGTMKIVDAQIKYRQGLYAEAVQILQECINTGLDNDSKYEAYALYGDCLKKQGEYSNAIIQYENAQKAGGKKPALLRKLGAAYLAKANADSRVDNESLSRAEECFKYIYNNYASNLDDKINLVQAYRLQHRFSEAQTLLEELTKEYPNDYRVYFQLSFNASDSNSTQVTVYLEKARLLYNQASQEDKDLISLSDLQNLKMLYQHYCNRVW